MAVMFSSNIFIANSCYVGRNIVVPDQKVISRFHFKLQKLASIMGEGSGATSNLQAS